MSKCGFNIDKDCIETKCHKCKLNPMYEQGRADFKDYLIQHSLGYKPNVEGICEWIIRMYEQMGAEE